MKAVSTAGKYSLAILRNKGYIGAQTALKMLAGRDIAGDLHDRHIITNAEHKVAAAQRFLSKELQTNYDEGTTAPEPEPQSHILAIENVQYKADATNQNAIQHNKILRGTTEVVSCGHTELTDSIASSDKPFDVQAFGHRLLQHKSFCTMQVVQHGTTQELYRN